MNSESKKDVEIKQNAKMRNLENATKSESSESKEAPCVQTLPSKTSDNTNCQSPAELHDCEKDQKNAESIDQLKNQLDIVMNSLATLSSEKSKMEANFQIDKKQLRSERDECERVIRDLKDRLKKAQNHNHSEMEHIKCKLIMERHDREKEQGEHSAIMKELQKLLSEERRIKEHLEGQLKTQFANKTQCKILEAELEITKNKLKQAEEAAKGTPPLLVSLQTEMTTMKKQHRNAIHEEQKRAAAAEHRANTLAMTHEARVAGLEARLAELSEIVGGYDRLRQQDLHAIQKLKEQLATLQEAEHKECVASGNDPEELALRIKSLYTRLLDLDNKKNDSIHVKSLLNGLNLCDSYKNSEYKEKYESLAQEFEDYKQQVLYKCKTVPNNTHSSQQQNDTIIREKSNTKSQLHVLKTHNSNLEERIRLLNSEILNKDKELQTQLDHQQKMALEDRGKYEQLILQKENEYRSKISILEQQLLRQRQRSVALVEERDKEILRLKASIRSLLPNNEKTLSLETKLHLARQENVTEPITDLVTGLFTNDGPPIFHYSQELARKEVQATASRKRMLELEGTIREKYREILDMKELQKEETKSLHAQITRLEACKSREGANLEYLKNVVINYLTTNDVSSKRHMLNAISTVLRFTPDELNRIKHSK